MTTEIDTTTGETASTRPNADHWGNNVEHYDGDGAGEKCACQECGERHAIALIAATADSWAERWEEFYKCRTCGATGTFRVDERAGHGNQRTWTGTMDYPDE
jgi:DNA-directed RNA polymerase subunit M/transcription elongation factor TFIIS